MSKMQRRRKRRTTQKKSTSLPKPASLPQPNWARLVPLTLPLITAVVTLLLHGLGLPQPDVPGDEPPVLPPGNTWL
jgi:hypothetical protein